MDLAVRRRLRRSGGEAGSGSVWVLAVAAVLVAAALGVTLFVGLVSAHRRAAAAADLAALGGAGQLVAAPWRACPAAAAVAGANGARLVGCATTPSSVTVSVVVTRVPPLAPAVTATARAGVPVIPFPVDG